MIYLYNSDFINLSTLLSHILKGARFYKPKGNYGPYKDGPNFIVNSLTDCPIKTVGVYTTYEKRTEQRGEKCVSKMEEDTNDLLGQGSSTLNSHQQTLSPTEEITAVGLHKSLHPVFEEGARAVEKVASEKTNQVKAKVKVKTISKQIEQMHRQNETDILLSRAIHLEQELGREPTILDFLCHFNHIEIDLMWDSLLFLYPSLGRKEWSSTTCPDVKQMRVLA